MAYLLAWLLVTCSIGWAIPDPLKPPEILNPPHDVEISSISSEKSNGIASDLSRNMKIPKSISGRLPTPSKVINMNNNTDSLSRNHINLDSKNGKQIPNINILNPPKKNVLTKFSTSHVIVTRRLGNVTMENNSSDNRNVKKQSAPLSTKVSPIRPKTIMHPPEKSPKSVSESQNKISPPKMVTFTISNFNNIKSLRTSIPFASFAKIVTSALSNHLSQIHVTRNQGQELTSENNKKTNFPLQITTVTEKNTQMAFSSIVATKSLIEPMFTKDHILHTKDINNIPKEISATKPSTLNDVIVPLTMSSLTLSPLKTFNLPSTNRLISIVLNSKVINKSQVKPINVIGSTTFNIIESSKLNDIESATSNDIKSTTLNVIESTTINNIESTTLNDIKSTLNVIESTTSNDIESRPLNTIESATLNVIESTTINVTESAKINDIKSTTFNDIESKTVNDIESPLNFIKSTTLNDIKSTTLNNIESATLNIKTSSVLLENEIVTKSIADNIPDLKSQLKKLIERNNLKSNNGKLNNFLQEKIIKTEQLFASNIMTKTSPIQSHMHVPHTADITQVSHPQSTIQSETNQVAPLKPSKTIVDMHESTAEFSTLFQQPTITDHAEEPNTINLKHQAVTKMIVHSITLHSSISENQLGKSPVTSTPIIFQNTMDKKMTSFPIENIEQQTLSHVSSNMLDKIPTTKQILTISSVPVRIENETLVPVSMVHDIPSPADSVVVTSALLENAKFDLPTTIDNKRISSIHNQTTETFKASTPQFTTVSHLIQLVPISVPPQILKIQIFPEPKAAVISSTNVLNTVKSKNNEILDSNLELNVIATKAHLTSIGHPETVKATAVLNSQETLEIFASSTGENNAPKTPFVKNTENQPTVTKTEIVTITSTTNINQIGTMILETTTENTEIPPSTILKPSSIVTSAIRVTEQLPIVTETKTITITRTEGNVAKNIISNIPKNLEIISQNIVQNVRPSNKPSAQNQKIISIQNVDSRLAENSQNINAINVNPELLTLSDIDQGFDKIIQDLQNPNIPLSSVIKRIDSFLSVVNSLNDSSIVEMFKKESSFSNQLTNRIKSPSSQRPISSRSIEQIQNNNKSPTNNQNQIKTNLHNFARPNTVKQNVHMPGTTGDQNIRSGFIGNPSKFDEQRQKVLNIQKGIKIVKPSSEIESRMLQAMKSILDPLSERIHSAHHTTTTPSQNFLQPQNQQPKHVFKNVFSTFRAPDQFSAPTTPPAVTFQHHKNIPHRFRPFIFPGDTPDVIAAKIEHFKAHGR